MISKIKLVTLPVRDQPAAVRFWTETMGFEKTTDAPMGEDARWIEVTPPGGGTRLVLFEPKGPFADQADRIGGFQPIVFTTDDVEASYEELTAKGVDFPQLPKAESWGTGSVFADPDGNRFALTEDVEAGIVE